MRVALVLSVGGCRSEAVVGVSERSQAVSARVGQEVSVTLGNVGPGTYESPPQMTPGVLTYLGVDVVPPFNPGGPTQRFRFSAAATGRTIVVFRRLLGETTLAIVQDTIDGR